MRVVNMLFESLDNKKRILQNNMALILYIAQDKKNSSRYEVGSVLCMSLVPHLNDQVHVVDATLSDQRPSWLKGTPTLLNETTGMVWTGLQAVRTLQELCINPPKRSQQKTSEKSLAAKLQIRSEDKQENLSITTSAKAESTYVMEDDQIWATPTIPEEDEEVTNGKMTAEDFARVSN